MALNRPVWGKSYYIGSHLISKPKITMDHYYLISRVSLSKISVNPKISIYQVSCLISIEWSGYGTDLVHMLHSAYSNVQIRYFKRVKILLERHKVLKIWRFEPSIWMSSYMTSLRPPGMAPKKWWSHIHNLIYI